MNLIIFKEKYFEEIDMNQILKAMRPHILHNGLHKIGDAPARIFDNERFLSRDPFDDLWMTRKETPSVNISTEEDKYVLEIALPAYKKEEVTVELSGQYLNIMAEKKNKCEFITQSLYRNFELPTHLDKESIKARIENGILYISIYYLKNSKYHKKITIE